MENIYHTKGGKTMTSYELRTFRKSLGLSQYQFAYLFGHGVSTIARWERGSTIPAYWVELFIHISNSGRTVWTEEVLIAHGRIEALCYIMGASYKSIKL